MRWLGRALLVLGALGLLALAGLFAWAQWTERTTDAVAARAQQQLAAELAGQGADEPVISGSAATPPPSPALGLGTPIGRLSFARAGQAMEVQPMVVVQGVGTEQLTQGPGHYPSTPLPSEAGPSGNVAIAGHRTTYGAPFRDLDRLRSGDVATLTTADATYRYRVVAQRVVDPSDTSVLDPDPLGTGSAMLTLTTCDPPGQATHRLIVFAERIG